MQTVSTKGGKPNLNPNRKVQRGSMVAAASTLVMYGITAVIFKGATVNPEIVVAASTLVTGAVSTILGFGAAYLTAPHPDEGVARVPS